MFARHVVSKPKIKVIFLGIKRPKNMQKKRISIMVRKISSHFYVCVVNGINTTPDYQNIKKIVRLSTKTKIPKKFLKIPDEENEILQTDNSVIKQLLEQNKTLIEKLNSMASEPKIVSYQNCGNKKMTVNLYLNQTCKDAMNLSDFVENLKISLEDLDYTKEHGFVKGISNIFVKHLADLNPTLRPIHCSDTKRLQFYVKDENKWEKDQQHEKLDKSIHDVTIKQIKQLHEWEKENPHYLKDDKSLEEWQKMVHSDLGGGEDNDREVNKELIKKKLIATTEIKDDMITIKND